MSIFSKVALFCAAGTLGACSTATTFTPAVSGSAGNVTGTYSITQNGATRALAAPSGTVASLSLSYWNDLIDAGYMYEGADVIAIAVMDWTSNETFAGISGTSATGVPTVGSASYAGSYSASYFRNGTTNTAWNARGTFGTTVNFGSGSITGSGTGNYDTSLSIAGTLTGTNFNGTAQFSGLEYTGSASVPVTGGLYGAGAATVAGIYQGTALTGVFWGQ